MNKTLIVAHSEFMTLVRSKAFIIGLVMMPIVMGVAVLLVRTTKDAIDVRDRTFAIVDRSGVIAGAVAAAAKEFNIAATGSDGKRVGPRFFPQPVSAEGRSLEDLRLELSERVRRKEIFAFVEIPADIVDPSSPAQMRYYSDHPSYTALPSWLRTTVNRAVLAERFRAAAVDPVLVARLTKPSVLEQLGLATRNAQGEVERAKQVDQVRTFGIPAIMLALMYITIMSSAPQLLNTVIEEKMSRISEVLIGSVTPFELMMGKLAGSASVSILLALIYIAGGLGVAQYFGYASALTPSTFMWFALFLLLGVFLFGSLFVAIGAACTDLKDSQNMMTPVMLVIMLPMMTWAAVLRAPDGAMATTLSLLPTATPFLMMLRVALHPGPPMWQVVLSVALTLLTVFAAVWAAGKIFRTGLLMQGKSASVAEMIRWVRAG
jgi:ABC-2 type transport system permease protein